GDEVAAAAAVAMAAMAAIPADAHPLARPPRLGPITQGVDHTGDLVPRADRIADAREQALDREDIAVADTAGLDAHPGLPGARLRDPALDDLERSFGLTDLGGPHGRHCFLPREFRMIAMANSWRFPPTPAPAWRDRRSGRAAPVPRPSADR